MPESMESRMWDSKFIQNVVEVRQNVALPQCRPVTSLEDVALFSSIQVLLEFPHNRGVNRDMADLVRFGCEFLTFKNCAADCHDARSVFQLKV